MRDIYPEVDPRDTRNETEDERLDRNWNEILQELRVTQTGTQILSGFLLTVVFQPKFEELNDFQVVVYLALVAVATLTTALALAPVHLHRVLFRKHSKAALVHIAHLLMRATLVGIAAVMTGTVLLIFDLALDRTSAVVGAAVVVIVVTLVALVPARVARRLQEQASRRNDQNDQDEENDDKQEKG